MHLSEGVLSPPILAAGAALAAACTAAGLRRLDGERLMSAAMLSAAFFVGSLIHVPIGPGNVHLILNGLLGMILGWAAFPCMLTALMLQAVLFQYGGITVLGVNTVTMAFPAVMAWYLFRPLLGKGPAARALGAFLGGALAVAGAGLITALCLAGTDEGFLRSAQLLLLAHIPVMIVEGLISMLTVSFLARVRPELLAPR
ncbi:MAG: cobalt transporter CbiM [Desulfovibrionaceae bacterium]|nr:cobalt transporter CbiM [Desulfovibrionaceae bacterium]